MPITSAGPNSRTCTDAARRRCSRRASRRAAPAPAAVSFSGSGAAMRAASPCRTHGRKTTLALLIAAPPLARARTRARRCVCAVARCAAQRFGERDVALARPAAAPAPSLTAVKRAGSIFANGVAGAVALAAQRAAARRAVQRVHREQRFAQAIVARRRRWRHRGLAIDGARLVFERRFDALREAERELRPSRCEAPPASARTTGSRAWRRRSSRRTAPARSRPAGRRLG